MLSVERANSLSETELSDTESACLNESHTPPEDISTLERIDKEELRNVKVPLIAVDNFKSSVSDKCIEEIEHRKDEVDEKEEELSSSSDSSECPNYVTPCSPKGQDVKKAERTRLGLMSNSNSNSGNLIRTSEESDEQYAKRLRKHNYLTLAQEFAARQRVEHEAATDMFSEHAKTNSNPKSEDSTTLGGKQSKNARTSPIRCVAPANATSWRLASMEGVTSGREHCPHLPLNNVMLASNQSSISRCHQMSLMEYENSCRNGSKKHRSHQRQHHSKSFSGKSESKCSAEKLTNAMNSSGTFDDLPANVIKMANYVPPVNEGRLKQESENKDRDPDKEEDTSLDNEAMSRSFNADVPATFDVYNIETTMPSIDWVAMEKRLARAAREDGLYRHKHRNNREEIRRKLAMGSDNEDYYGGERGPRKPSLQSRLQSGMNLQICFMNETANDNESTAGNSSELSQAITENSAAPNFINNVNTPLEVGRDKGKPNDLEPTNFISKQARLQAEARVALAQAKQMARMQMEVEKQRKKKSPIAEIVGIPFPDGKYKLSRHALSEMNFAQLQVIVNDLHTQIENLNEELVRLLLERDDLHMEQDSMLVDIEDLTRYLCANAQEGDRIIQEEKERKFRLPFQSSKKTSKLSCVPIFEG